MTTTTAVGGPTEQGVANLIYGLAEAVDDADGPRIEALVGSATFRIDDLPPVTGGAGVRQLIEPGATLHDGSQRTQHVITNLAVTIDRVTASATSSARVAVLQAVPGDLPLRVVLAGRYDDRFAWTDAGWAFVERHLHVTLRGDDAGPRPTPPTSTTVAPDARPNP